MVKNRATRSSRSRLTAPPGGPPIDCSVLLKGEWLEMDMEAQRGQDWGRGLAVMSIIHGWRAMPRLCWLSTTDTLLSARQEAAEQQGLLGRRAAPH